MALSVFNAMGVSEAHAQLVLPEQVLTLDRALVQGAPGLTALHSKVFGHWLSYIETPRVGVGYAHSADKGSTWIGQVGFPITDADPSVVVPAASCLDLVGGTHFVACDGPVLYFRGAGTPTVVWSAPVASLPLVPGFAGYHVTAMACEPMGEVLYAASTEPYGGLTDVALVSFARSLDAGTSWTSPSHPGSSASIGPSMTVGGDATLIVSSLDVAESRVAVLRSGDRGATFSVPITAADVNDNLGTPPFGWEPGLGPLYYPGYRKSGLAPNFPALAVDRSSGSTRGNLYLVWSEYADGSIAPATATLGSTSDNNSFDTALLVPLDSDVTGSMPDIHVSNRARYIAFDGTAGQMVWIDGTASPFQHAYYLFWEMSGGSRVFSHAAYLTSPDPAFGRTAPTILSLPYTGRYYLRVDPPIGTSVSFRFRVRTYQPFAGSASRDMRDIVLVRSTDGGQTWSAKLRVNHDPPGLDQHQPNVAVDELGHVYVAWYDRRGIPFGDSVHAYATVSSDGGLTFGPDLKLSSRPSGWRGVPESQFQFLPGALIGDRIAIAAGDDYAIVAWTDLRNWPDRSDIYAARIVDVPTSVEAVSDLSAEPTEAGVRLRWIVNDVREVSGLRVYRASSAGVELPLGDADLVPTREGEFEYLDRGAEPGQTYTYRLAVRSGENTRWLGPVTVETPARVTALACRAAGPNPFGRRTAVALAVPRTADGSVRVYDIQGKAVRTLAEGRFTPGERRLEWDGRDELGAQTAPGIYFVSAEVGGEHARLRVARVP